MLLTVFTSRLGVQQNGNNCTLNISTKTSGLTSLIPVSYTHLDVYKRQGYITEGQLFLRRDSDIGKVIVDPFRSLSRLKQLVTGKKTRKDHPQVMNAAVRLYADAANAKTKIDVYKRQEEYYG